MQSPSNAAQRWAGSELQRGLRGHLPTCPSSAPASLDVWWTLPRGDTSHLSGLQRAASVRRQAPDPVLGQVPHCLRVFLPPEPEEDLEVNETAERSVRRRRAANGPSTPGSTLNIERST